MNIKFKFMFFSALFTKQRPSVSFVLQFDHI